MSRLPGESFNEWLDREDPDGDAIYESWRDRKGDLMDPAWRKLLGYGGGVMSTEEEGDA
jgi:hypothetical protein